MAFRTLDSIQLGWGSCRPQPMLACYKLKCRPQPFTAVVAQSWGGPSKGLLSRVARDLTILFYVYLATGETLPREARQRPEEPVKELRWGLSWGFPFFALARALGEGPQLSY